MILVRRTPGEPAEELTLAEFERRAQSGEVAPQHEVCFPAVTGDEFVPARNLELYQGLYASGLITFRHYFHLARMPWMTLSLIGILCLTYFVWQGGPPVITEDLVRLGAKSPVLMVELGQWWRLVSANFIHVSGWHLAVNAVFLFNLGGPTEAVFRRHDYALVIVAALIGTNSLSAVANPTVSCGASGLVFGVWGAAAVFGMRHRTILPDRYRRYFMGSVIPYSIFALYVGFAIPGIDNWGHLGGLVAGSVTALFLPPRLLVPRDRLLAAKILGLATCGLGLTVASMMPRAADELSDRRYYPRGGLIVPLPTHWAALETLRDGRAESYAYSNGAGVTVGIQSRLEQRPVQGKSLGRDFVETDLAAHLEASDARGLKIAEPQSTLIQGHAAQLIHAQILTPNLVADATYLVMARGYYHYAVSLTAPRWLAPAYQATFTRIIDGIELGEPDELLVARERLAAEATPYRHAQLAVAQAHAGELTLGLATLDDAMRRWPNNKDLAAVKQRLQLDARRPNSRGEP